MKINVNQKLKTLDGQTMKDVGAKGEAIDATLKMSIVNAILSPVQNEKGVDKVKKYELATKIYKAKQTVDLTAEDIVLIKDRVGEIFPPLVVGQVFKVLEELETDNSKD